MALTASARSSNAAQTVATLFGGMNAQQRASKSLESAVAYFNRGMYQDALSLANRIKEQHLSHSELELLNKLKKGLGSPWLSKKPLI